MAKLRTEEKPEDKLFYFKEFHDSLTRIIKSNPSSELILLDQVLNLTSNHLRGQFSEKPDFITSDLIESLADPLERIKENIKEEKLKIAPLCRMAVLTYQTTDAGKFITEKNKWED